METNNSSDGADGRKPGGKRSRGGPKGVNLPAQLVSLIHGEESSLREAGYLLPDLAAPEEDDGDGGRGLLVDEGTSASVSAAAAATPPPPQLLKQPSSSSTGTASSLNQITSAAQARSTRELSSYVRAVCMRLGFHE
jgi:hypothetical protein